MNPQQSPSQPFMDPKQNPAGRPPQPALDPKQQVAALLKGAANVLVTVSANPSVDQLASAIATGLVLNKLGKHATAVFSGQVPSIIQFLQPEKNLSKSADSLRDFIIALDKAKADKLRYKVEDKFVKIFITPYHTNLSQKDLEFSQGEYNIDVVLAIGVKKKEDLDQAIIAHGRILHDASVISLNIQAGADVGSINLTSPTASSLSEILVSIVELMKEENKPILDSQIATAFLTGIVAQTQRFSNAKTTPQTMSIAARLMNAGANQQLVATKLEEPQPIPQVALKTPPPPIAAKPASPPKLQPAILPKPAPPMPKPTAGVIEIDHDNKPSANKPADGGEDEDPDSVDKIQIDDEGTLRRLAELEAAARAKEISGETPADDRKVLQDAPQTAKPLRLSDPLAPPSSSGDSLASQPSSAPLLTHDVSDTPSIQPPGGNVANDKTLSDIEKSVDSPHLDTKVDEVKSGGSIGLPPVLQTTDSPSTGGPTPPPVPPPLPMASPPTQTNLSDPNTGVPL